MTSHFIFYVADQGRATEFYRQVLGAEPRLEVPGMTEFDLPGGAVLGLMPEDGICRLLGDAIPNPSTAAGIPRAELYLVLPNPDDFLERATAAGASVLSGMQSRDWGHTAAYCADLDGHILAFASDPNAPLDDSPTSAKQIAAISPSANETGKQPSLFQRLHNAVGPIAAGLVLDFFDLVTLGPIGWTVGPFIGLAVGWYLGGFYNLRRSRRFGLAVLSAGYLAMPMTALIPVGTIIAALAKIGESKTKPAPPC